MIQGAKVIMSSLWEAPMTAGLHTHIILSLSLTVNFMEYRHHIFGTG